MSCWMSSWDVNPTIRYILCAFAHIVVAMCVCYLVVRAFLALLGKNGRH